MPYGRGSSRRELRRRDRGSAIAVAVPAAGAAAEIPIGAMFAVGLVGLLAYAVARGLLGAWTHTLGFLLNWLGDSLSFRIPTGFGHVNVEIGAPFHEVDRLTIKALQTFATGGEHLAAYMFHGAARLQEWVAAEIADVSIDTYRWAAHLVGVHLPHYTKTIVEAAVPEAEIARLVEAAVAARIPSIKRIEHEVEADIASTLHKTLPAVAAIALPAPWAFPSFRRWAHDIAQWRHVTGHRLRRLEALLAASGLALAVARMLGVPNYRCLTRGNLSRVARALCGMDRALLDLFLLGTVEAFVAADLCGFTKLLTAEAKKIVPALLELVAVENALLACSGVSALAPIGLPALSLPSTPAPAALAG